MLEVLNQSMLFQFVSQNHSGDQFTDLLVSQKYVFAGQIGDVTLPNYCVDIQYYLLQLYILASFSPPFDLTATL